MSEKSVQIMEYKQFIQFLQQASRLGYSFGLAHDATPFFKKQESNILEALKEYARSATLPVFQFGVENLAKEKSFVNGKLVAFYKKKLDKIKSDAEKSRKEKDFLD